MSATRALAILALLASGPACARTIIASDPAGEMPPSVASGAAGAAPGRSEPLAGARAAPPDSVTPPDPDTGSAGSGATSSGSDMPTTDSGGSGSGEETWIGELWSIAPLLCDPAAPWKDTPLVVQPVGYIEPVVIVLDPGGDPAAPEGVIAFGRGELPATPGPEATASSDSGSFWLCSIQLPSKGGVYALRDTRRSTDRLTLGFVPAAIWNTACDGDFANCSSCAGPACEGFGRAVTLDLVVRGDMLQGSFITSGFGTPSELRLTRQR